MMSENNESNVGSKNSFHTISKIIEENKDDSNTDEENGHVTKNDKEPDSELNESLNLDGSNEMELIEHLKMLISKHQNELNNSKEDFDRLAKQILDKSQTKYSTIGKNKLIKIAKKVFSFFELEFALNDVELFNSSTELKPSRASSSSGYNSIPSPSSSSSSGSSQKHSIKTDSKNSNKKFKPSTEAPKSSFLDIKTSKSTPTQNQQTASNSPFNSFNAWNPGLLDPEFLRLAANTNPLLRFPDFGPMSTNPYLNNFNSFSNFFKPNFPLTQSFTPPTTPKKEISQDNKLQQNGNKTIPPQSMRIQANKNENGLTSSLASSKFKLSNKLSKLSHSEIQTVKSLINSYRESAAFLSRSADELEQIINEINEN